ncbi:MAG: glycosyltransferase family 2 protein [Corynebacterium sp.]|uniref:glycosyltransferase family A protein n=1 Tax=Corynebacterium sp. TaxID=1720 RepID=UPI0026DD7941|nr:glycosyltransferase family 2 protein [Corynebacterium sp.]MDO4761909.1 glycosyltransferase family 2 protein [Corynebacterium sp.]
MKERNLMDSHTHPAHTSTRYRHDHRHPLISIIVAVHNAEEHINSFLTQLAALTYTNYECIIITDHCTDNTLALIKNHPTYTQQTNTIRILNSTTPGVSHAREQATLKSTGDWIWFVDVDDTFEENILTEFAHLHNLYPSATLLHLGAEHTFPNKAPQPVETPWPSRTVPFHSVRKTTDTTTYFVPSTKTSNLLSHILNGHIRGYLWNKLIPGPQLRALATEGFYHSTTQNDFNLLISFLQAHPTATVAYNPTVYYHYIHHPEQLSTTAGTRTVDNTLQCIQRVLALPNIRTQPAHLINNFLLWAGIIPCTNTLLDHAAKQHSQEKAHQHYQRARQLKTQLNYSPTRQSLRHFLKNHPLRVSIHALIHRIVFTQPQPGIGLKLYTRLKG